MISVKKILIVASVMLLAAACGKNQPAPVRQDQSPSPQAQQSTPVQAGDSQWQTYRYVPYGFQFDYPKNFAFTDPANYNSSLGHGITELVSTDNPYPGTNYIESIFSVSGGYAKNLEECLKPLQSGLGPNDFKQAQTINGISFYKASATEGAAGNFYNSTVYRTLHADVCVEVNLVIHTGNIGNYPEEKHIQELDQSKPVTVLDQMLSTFKFTP